MLDTPVTTTWTSRIQRPHHLPTQYELPSDDNEPMETERHKKQMDLLIYSLRPWLSQQEQGGYVGGNMFVYYSPDQVRNEDYKGPDVFVVLGVPTVERLSWVVWDEGKGPDVVIELLSDSTATNDKNDKKTIYQDQLQVPEYFWYDPFNSKDLAGFRLTDGVYQKVKPQHGRLLSHCLGLSLVRWRGVYQGVKATWLRWATLEGKLLLLSEVGNIGRKVIITVRRGRETAGGCRSGSPSSRGGSPSSSGTTCASRSGSSFSGRTACPSRRSGNCQIDGLTQSSTSL